MEEGRFDNIKIEKMYPIENCLFYTIGASLSDEDINDIDTIAAFESKLSDKNINCIKLYADSERIVYREVNNKEGEQEIVKDSDNFKTVCLKLIKYSRKVVKPDSNTMYGLPTLLIKEYAKKQSNRETVNYIGAENNKDTLENFIPDVIHIKKIENDIKNNDDAIINSNNEIKIDTKDSNTNTANNDIVKNSVQNTDTIKNLSKHLNPHNQPFETYILGTQTHVSSFMIRDNDNYYVFDTTGHTHQIQKDGDQYYTTQLIFDKETLLPNGEKLELKDTVIKNPILLNPFGLDYQNGSSACGIWTSNVLAVALTHTNIREFIMEDTINNIAMFKSEFILKVSAKVSETLSIDKPEVKVLESEEEDISEDYCKCKIGNSLFAIDTKYKKNSCLDMKSILLSISEEELKYYNTDHVNDKIIEERTQLLENIKTNRIMYETAMEAIKIPDAIKSKVLRQKVYELKTDELGIVQQEINKLREAIKIDMIKLKTAKQEADKPETDKLNKINEKITNLETDREKKQLEYYTKLIQYFAKIFNIENNNNNLPYMIKKMKYYCEAQIKTIDNQINHAGKIDGLSKSNYTINNMDKETSRSQQNSSRSIDK